MARLEILKECFRTEIRRFMKLRNMNQDDLAMNTKFSPSEICKILAMKRNCTLETLDAVAGGLNCSVKIVLVPDDENKL